jgi:hypothetical protein
MRFHLYRGGVLLGIVAHTPDERVDGGGWDVGRLVPTPAFESVRPFLQSEQLPLDGVMESEADADHDNGMRRSEQLLELAGGLQHEIVRPGIWLVSMTDGHRMNVGELHVEADKVFWR